MGQIADLGLARRTTQDGRALSQHGGQKRVFGGADRNEGELDLGALQTLGRAGGDIAFVQLDLGAQRRQRLQVQIDRTRADGAAARQRDLGLAGARQ